jgi:hypothetical protein
MYKLAISAAVLLGSLQANAINLNCNDGQIKRITQVVAADQCASGLRVVIDEKAPCAIDVTGKTLVPGHYQLCGYFDHLQNFLITIAVDGRLR